MTTLNKNALYYGDNLQIVREYIPNESIDLIYLDPPFNSKRTYNVLFADESGKDSQAQIAAFEDTWHWDRNAEEAYRELIINSPPRVARMIDALHEFIGTNQMMAYLVMMTIRLVELHRVLKDTGSLYLHCDPTASHYLKIILDTIFSLHYFQNEIIWKRNFTKKGSQYKMTRLGNNSDTILFYTKSNHYNFETPRVIVPQKKLEKKYNLVDENGRRFKSEPLELPRMMARKNLIFEFMGYTPKFGWMMVKEKLETFKKQDKIYFTKSGKPRRKNFLDDYEGTEIGNIWTDIFPIGQNQAESLGYPTQKPLALLERIIQASSNEGDWVLDPFCGCGTAVAAAQKLNRNWIGIDITHLSISLQKYRLKDAFNIQAGKDYEVIGEPQSVASARQLALDDRYQFQWWALSLVGAKPLGGQAGSKKGKKGKDKGIDGIINFIEAGKGKVRRIIVQVKSGKVKSGDIRDLKGTVEREQAAIGVFITLEAPSKDMNTEAVSTGFYESKGWNMRFAKIQILTIKQLLEGAEVQMPPSHDTFKKAQKIIKEQSEQVEMM